MWDWNIATGEVYYSPRWIDTLGYKPEEVPASYEFWTNRIHPDDAPAVMVALEALVSANFMNFSR